ncbi:MAG: hypothetical protein AB8H12_09900 [Lewinella sp.]
MSTTMTIGGGSFAAFTDGTGGGQQAIWWQRNINVVGQEVLKMVFPSPTVLVGFETTGSFFLDNGVSYQIEGSNDGTNWTDLTGAQTFSTVATAPAYGASENSYKFPIAGNATAYAQYRIYGLAGQTDWNWVSEIYLGTVPLEQAQLTNITCNSSGSLFNAADDYITFDLNPTGGTGTYTVAVAGTTVTPSTGTFGATTSFSLGAGTAGGGDLSMTISGFTAGCQITETLTDPGNCLPGPCGEPNWNDPAMKATIVGDFAIPGTGATSGPIAVLVDSDQGSGVGSKSNTATNRAVFTFQFPQATVLTGVEINVSAADVIRTATTMRVEASNDGTNYTPVSIDYVLGTNLSSGAPQYGGTATVAYTLPFASNQTEYTYYRVFAPTMRTNFGRSFNEIYFDYEFFDPMVTNITCDNNSTLFEFDDDGVVFTMDPGPGTGTYDISLVGSAHSITPTTATYGQETTFTVSNGSAGTGDLTVRLIDASTPCVQEFIIPNETNACIPGSCGTLDWNMVTNKQNLTLSATASTNGNINVLKDGNDNNNNFYYPSNSIAGLEVLRVQFPEAAVITGIEYAIGNSYMFNTNATVTMQGSEDGSTWVDLVPVAAGTSPSMVISGNNYVKNRGLGNNHPGVLSSAPNAETLIWSNTTAYTYYRILGVAGNMNLNPWVNELYFAYDIFDAQVGNISFGDNGTPGAPNDDKLLFELNPAPGTGTYRVEGQGGYTVTPATATYGAVTSFEVSSGSAGTGDLTVLVIDESVPCVQEVVVPNPNLVIDVTASQAACASPTDSPLGSITLTSPENVIIKAEYNIGTQYFGTGFASATDVTGLNTGFVMVNNLPNPDFQTFYTVRAYASATLFRDYVVSISPKVCSVADLELSISPASETANEGENVVYTVTLTNNGPDPAVNVEVKVDLLDGLDLINASTTLGGYSPGTELWTIDQVPLGSQTLTITYRMR